MASPYKNNSLELYARNSRNKKGGNPIFKISPQSYSAQTRIKENNGLLKTYFNLRTKIKSLPRKLSFSMVWRGRPDGEHVLLESDALTRCRLGTTEYPGSELENIEEILLRSSGGSYVGLVCRKAKLQLICEMIGSFILHCL